MVPSKRRRCRMKPRLVLRGACSILAALSAISCGGSDGGSDVADAPADSLRSDGVGPGEAPADAPADASKSDASTDAAVDAGPTCSTDVVAPFEGGASYYAK